MQDIRLKGLTKTYGAVTALAPVTAVMPAGETTCLLGPSGCGKTTLFRLLLGLETVSDGSFSGMPEGVSVVFQEDRLLPEFSAVANIKAVTGKRATEAEIEQVLGELGLVGWERRPVKELSGGMKRRVAIGRALMYPAELYMMDEPFKGLDEATKGAVMACVEARTRGKTLLVITHDEGEAAFFGGHIVRLGK